MNQKAIRLFFHKMIPHMKRTTRVVLRIAAIIAILLIMIVSVQYLFRRDLELSIIGWESNYINYRMGGWYIDENIVETDETIDMIYSPSMWLDKGTYTIQIDYECENDQGYLVHGNSANAAYIDAGLDELRKDKKSISHDFVLEEDVADFEILIKYNGKGALHIKNISIKENRLGLLKEQLIILCNLAKEQLIILCNLPKEQLIILCNLLKEQLLILFGFLKEKVFILFSLFIFLIFLRYFRRKKRKPKDFVQNLRKVLLLAKEISKFIIIKFKEFIIVFLAPKNILIYLSILIAFFLSWIQLELSSTYDKWIDVFTMSAEYIMINIMTICTVYLFIYLVTDSLWNSYMIFCVFITLLSVVNYYVIQFHGTPLTFMELKNLKTALAVIGYYKFDIKDILDLICILGVEFALYYIIKKLGLKRRRKRRVLTRLVKDFCLFSMIIGIVFYTYLSSYPFMNKKVLGAWANDYHQYGYAACTVKLAVDSAHFLQKPDGYENGIDNIKFVKGEHDSTENERPDIILILNESFYDLSLITDIKTDVPYLENINALENTIKGYAVVPYIGGSTNCSEYELLTSNSLRLMPGITPFNVINMEGANTIVSHLKQLGYYTIGGHPEKGSNYNRINAYADMGFDKYYFYNDFVDRKSYGNKWVMTDESAYENLLLWMRGQTATPQFTYLLTIQNHGEWDKNEKKYDTVHVSNDYGEYNEVIDEYLTGIKMSDSAFKYLTDQLKMYDKKVIVCMVGDHSPSFANQIVDQEHSSNSSLLLRSTPFIIWANFDIEDKDMGTISMNYMIPTLLKTAKVPLSQYYQYMLNLREAVPILTSYNAYYDKNMNEYLYDGDSEYSEEVNNYFYMEYNNLQKDRKQQFFDAF